MTLHAGAQAYDTSHTPSYYNILLMINEITLDRTVQDLPQETNEDFFIQIALPVGWQHASLKLPYPPEDPAVSDIIGPGQERSHL